MTVLELRRRLFLSKSEPIAIIREYLESDKEGTLDALYSYSIMLNQGLYDPAYSDVYQYPLTKCDHLNFAASMLACEVEYQKELNRHRRACTPYSEHNIKENNAYHPFHKKDRKEAEVLDYIDYSAVKRIEQSYLIYKDKLWAVIDYNIPAEILEWMDRCFTNSPRYVRIDPDRIYQNKPTNDKLFEAITVRPTNNKWWKTLQIYKGTGDGSSYYISDEDRKNPLIDKEYTCYHIRKLESSVTRKNNGNLSMMIEELAYYSNPANTSDHYVLGRMIHLDTNAQVGVSFDNAILNHIDLALNMYVGDAADNRLAADLATANGVIQSAKPRTHILRVENVPFNTMLKFADKFFKSQFLVNEWIQTEFS